MDQELISTGKKIVVLSDGTGNFAAKIFRTNVWRLYQALDLSAGARQVAQYDDGVGSSNYKVLAMLGGAVGWGLKRNVIDLFMFICRNYRPGDQIYAFGFSRGAFTARVLVKLILSQGLITNFHSDDDLRWKARELYRNFRRERKTRFGLATIGRAIRDVFFVILNLIFCVSKQSIKVDRTIKIAFLGVWDTVDAYGIPIDELKMGIDRYIWPLALEDRYLDERVDKACHAIGIDDKRTTFHPLLWDEGDQVYQDQLPSRTDDEKLTQVFFAGVHANVGGGYPDDALSLVPLNWMMKEAAKHGLVFKQSAIVDVEQSALAQGRLYDSRSGFASYYRYEPRHLGPPRDKQLACIPFPKVHEAVFVRMVTGTDTYAPLALPAPVRVIVEETWADIQSGKKCSQNILSLDEYAGLEISSQGYPKIGKAPRGSEVLARVKSPDLHFKALTWDTVWWRRVAYFTTLFATAALLISPKYSLLTSWYVFAMPATAFGFPGLTGAIESFWRPAVDLLASSLDAALPSAASPWLSALRADPGNFLTLLLLLIVCIFCGKLIDRRINDRSFASYSAAWRELRLEWVKQSFRWRRITAWWSGLAGGGLLVLVLYLQLNEPSCAENDWLCSLFQAIRALARVIVGAVLLGIFAYSMFSVFMLRRLFREEMTEEPRGLALLFANRVRNSERLVRAYRWVTSKALPAAFAALVLLNSVGLLNRFFFNLLSEFGQVCMANNANEDVFLAEGEIRVVFLQYSSVCQLTDINLVQGSRYAFWLVWDEAENEPVKSLNKKQLASVEKQLKRLPQNSPFPNYGVIKKFLAFPFRRVISEPFFSVTARVDANRSEERTLPWVGSESFSPERGGPLFLYVNDMVVGVPGLYGAFYSQRGGFKVAIQKLS
ncbi:DUF2235 domain-containing protein [Bradyrhizobium sp. AZCC 2289]|uniref:DUF2235 domain-containing protein n=1 Tax=Bradyrhizobium sp. AZCC 2289 TaxID=3117026 RepID=UPI002FF2A325